MVVALSNGDYLVEDGDNAFNGNSIAGKIYTSAGSLVGSVTLPAYSFGQVIALNGASDPSFVAPVTDPAYDAALATYANFTDVSDNLFVNSYTSAGTQSAGPTQIDTGTAKGVLNSTSSYYSTDTAPTYSLSSELNGGLIEVDSAPDQNTGTTSTITVRLFDWPGGGPVAPSVSAITPTGSSPTKSASDEFHRHIQRGGAECPDQQLLVNRHRRHGDDRHTNLERWRYDLDSPRHRRLGQWHTGAQPVERRHDRRRQRRRGAVWHL